MRSKRSALRLHSSSCGSAPAAAEPFVVVVCRTRRSLRRRSFVRFVGVGETIHHRGDDYLPSRISLAAADFARWRGSGDGLISPEPPSMRWRSRFRPRGEPSTVPISRSTCARVGVPESVHGGQGGLGFTSASSTVAVVGVVFFSTHLGRVCCTPPLRCRSASHHDSRVAASTSFGGGVIPSASGSRVVPSVSNVFRLWLRLAFPLRTGPFRPGRIPSSGRSFAC